MINNFKVVAIKTIGIMLIISLCLQLKIITLKKEKQLEKEKKVENIKEEKKSESKISIEGLLILDDYFNISKIENYKTNHWIAYIDFKEPLEDGIKKVEYLMKKDFTIQNYNVEYKDGYGNFNLKIKVGD